ncbi:MAG: TlpA family protein disulfide reductase [Crocinitomicaceae bacterium]
MKKLLGYITIFLTTWTGFAQSDSANVVIEGYAPAFIGKMVKLNAYQDYVTRTKINLATAMVRPSDSSFTIQINTRSTIEGVIEIDQTEASMYIAPNTDYTVYFPEATGPKTYQNAQTNLYFSDLDTLDINYLVIQYHQWLDTYIAYHERDIAHGNFLVHLDTFKLYAADAYKNIEDPYFITYVRYDLAELEQTFGGNRQSEQRLQTYLEYIEPFPVYYENDRYMKFLLAFYDKEFREYLPVTEEAILKAINKSSPTLLMKALRNDILLAKPDVRELVMIDKLGKAYYREIDLQTNILKILDSVSTNSQSLVNANVAKNVKDYLTNLESGYPAPQINLNADTENPLKWSTYKGKFVYFNFFTTWNEQAIRDMEIISEIRPTYMEDITFLSVCTDEDTATFNQFMADHPEYNWDIVHIGEGHKLTEAYKVTSLPAYFLIDQDGFIFSAPALAPSPNAKYQTIKDVFDKIQYALHPPERPRVGE